MQVSLRQFVGHWRSAGTVGWRLSHRLTTWMTTDWQYMGIHQPCGKLSLRIWPGSIPKAHYTVAIEPSWASSLLSAQLLHNRDTTVTVVSQGAILSLRSLVTDYNFNKTSYHVLKQCHLKIWAQLSSGGQSHAYSHCAREYIRISIPIHETWIYPHYSKAGAWHRANYY